MKLSQKDFPLEFQNYTIGTIDELQVILLKSSNYDSWKKITTSKKGFDV